MNEWPKELQKIYGLEPLETDVLYPGQSNLINFEGKEYPVYDYCETLINCTGKVLATYSIDFYRNTPAIVEHSYGAGKGYYLACRTAYSFLGKFYEKIASEFVPEIPITKFNSRVSIQIRENKSEKYWLIQNFSDKEEKIELSCELVNLLEDVKDKGIVGLKPFESKVYKLCR